MWMTDETWEKTKIRNEVPIQWQCTQTSKQTHKHTDKWIHTWSTPQRSTVKINKSISIIGVTQFNHELVNRYYYKTDYIFLVSIVCRAYEAAISRIDFESYSRVIEFSVAWLSVTLIKTCIDGRWSMRWRCAQYLGLASRRSPLRWTLP